MNHEHEHDYELTLKVRNAPLLKAMKEFGIETAAELSRKTGAAQNTIGDFLNLSRTPYAAHGGLLKPAQRLCDFFMCDVDRLFPAEHLENPLEQNAFTAYVDAQEMAGIAQNITTDPAQLIEEIERHERTHKAIETLSPRKQKVLALTYGLNGEEPQTLLEVGLKLGISPERVRQIQQSAFRTIRDPRRRAIINGITRTSDE